MKISAVIIARNEATHIEKCVKALSGIVDEVLVCDTGSADETAKLAERAGARVIHEPFAGYGETKNRANNAAQYDWILSIDADEIPDETLSRHLCDIKQHLNNGCVYSFSRLNSYCGKWIHYGAWNPDCKIRLFNKQQVCWNNEAVHETLFIPEHFSTINLKGKLLHYSYPTAESLIAKRKIYSERGAQALLERGIRPTYIKMYASAVSRFVRDYVLKLGFLDGREGCVIAWNSAVETYLKYFNALQHLRKSATGTHSR
ncbi:MAG: glycosyltransferase family 2 protein [Bacteroidota bacterium]|jgi:glycosyltransferase involved in cell wall biosynthesis